MTRSEKMRSVTAEEFGYRIAKAFDESRSSTTVFFIQQAFADCEDDVGLLWEEFDDMLKRFISQKG